MRRRRPVLGQVTIQKDDMLEVSLRDPKSKAANAAPQPVSLKDLPQTVQQLAAQAGLSLDAMPVLIAADKNVKYDAVMRALNLLKQHGVERVGLAVQSNPS
jgi:Biopolymer transport protein